MMLAALLWFSSLNPTPNTDVCFGTTNDCAWLRLAGLPATGTTNNAPVGTLAGKSLLNSNGMPVRVGYRAARISATAATVSTNSITVSWQPDYLTAAVSFAAKRDTSGSPRCLMLMRVVGNSASVVKAWYVAVTTWQTYQCPLTFDFATETGDSELVIGWMSCVGSDTNGTWRLDNLRMDVE